jgi:general secretion pathway protein D
MAGCPKGQPDFNQGKKAETLQDYDAAFVFYQKAVKANPYNAGYKIKLNKARFEASELHVKQGVAFRKKGDLQGAAGEFERAQAIDPSNPVAEQELRATVEMIAEKNRAADAAAVPPGDPNEAPLASSTPQLKPLSRAPINLKMNNDAKLVFDTIGKLAGLTVIYDPDFPARRIPVDLNNVTLEQALEIVSIESKAFVKPVTENVILVIPEQPQKRRDYDEEVVKTLYISNTVQPQDLTEIVTALRQLLDIKRMQPLNSQNAIVVRDTPDKILLAEKMLKDVDRAKPEVVIQVEVLEARTDRLRDLGILPGQHASISINPNTTSSSSSTTTTPTTLNQLRHLTGSSYDVTLPSLTANAVLTDTNTKIIQNPEVRSVDGQTAKLKIGDRIPIATGSFSSGIGIGGATAAGGISPLVNTQFTYIDVGVIIDLTPRVHPNRDVSLKLKVEVSAHTSDVSIGGITQPVISQRIIEDDIRMKEGEVSILGGLVQRTDRKTIEGWPGLAKLPLLKYFFSHDNTDLEEDEVLIVLTPRIVRMPEWTKANLRPIYSGSETFVQVMRESATQAPVQQPPATAPAPTNQNMGGAAPAAMQPPGAAAPAAGAVQGAATAKIRFEPQNLTLKAGQKATIGILIDNVNDLVSIPLLLQYNPAVISVEEIQHGGFLSGGTQEVPYVQQIFPDKGQAIISATRGPNTQGVSGSGTLMGIVVKAVAPGTSNLSIVQVNAKDSQQRPIPLISSEATLQVQQ